MSLQETSNRVFRPLEYLKQKPDPVPYQELQSFSSSKEEEEEKNKDNNLPQENSSVLIGLVENEVEQNSKLERETVLERLQANGFLVKPCHESPIKEDQEESSSQSLTPEVRIETPVEIVEDLIENRINKPSKKIGKIRVSMEDPSKDIQINKEIDDLPKTNEDVLSLPKESKYDEAKAESELEVDKSVVFVLCSSKTEEKPPGKEPSEKILKGRMSDFFPLAKIPQWRQQLCNSFDSPFTLDDQQWQNIDHFLIAAQYRQYSMPSAFAQYESALMIHKTKKHDSKKMKVDEDYQTRIKQEMFHALYAKFTQHPGLARILDATQDAQLYYRVNKQKKVEFTELMWLRQLLRPYVRQTLKPLSEESIAPKEKKKVDKEVKEYDLSELSIGTYATQLPQYEPDVLKASSYYLTNRTQYIQRINDLYRKYGENSDNDSGSKEFDLLSHQKVVRDYLDMVSPYRGLLIYHNLGTGKSCTSIAVTEGMKSNKRIIIMVPASLKRNYEFELQKCGDLLYRQNQHWERVSTDGKPDLIPILAKALGMSTREIEKNKGAWMVNVNKEPNFKNLDPEEQMMVREQIHHMIHQKYTFLHYNANNLATKINDMKTISKNPFDHTTVVIDEAHNFISNIVGNLKKQPKTKDTKQQTSIYTKIYDLLMDATDLKIVMLSGTPIINYPQEVAVMFNILRGYIYTWTFKLNIKTTEKVNTDYIRSILDKNRCMVYDYIEYTRNALVVTRNPYGFVNVNGSTAVRGKTAKTHNASARETKRTIGNLNASASIQKGGYGTNGVKLHDYGNISNDDFKKQIVRILADHDIVVESSPRMTKETCLPHDEKVFQSTFIRETTNYADKKDQSSDILHIQTLKRRILGLTSYFRSPNESLLPSFVPNSNGGVFHEVRVPMSDYQFAEYAKVRKIELDKEKKQKKMKILQMAMNNTELFQMSSTYRVFSRTLCNFAFPTPPGRPFPKLKQGKEETEEDANGASKPKDAGEAEEDTIEDGDTYEKEIENAMKFLKENATSLLSLTKLKEYSLKMTTILSNIQNDKHVGLHLLYSNFVTIEGIGIFREVLHINGFQEFKIKKFAGNWILDYEPSGKKCYALYTGEEDPETREIVRNVFNGDWDLVPDTISLELRKVSSNNMYGEIIKLFMITAAGAEGINLKNTRYVHIMEPYWHNVRLEQVIGRARRIKSHELLPEELRTVQVFLYISVMSEKQKTDDKFKEIQVNDLSKMIENTPVTTDEYLYEIAQMKQKINGQFLRVIKETAMDCHLYVQKHNKHEPLVCYGKGFAPDRTFVSYPTQKMDLQEDPDSARTTKPGRGQKNQK
jgi:predicted NAD-dependent protein-ADP-ribosyltransferase YbiA (DUF1768 family)